VSAYIVRAIKCDRCGDRLEIRIHERQDRDGKPYYAEDLSDVESHATAHAYRALEARYGMDESKWPDNVTAMRKAMGDAEKKASRASARGTAPEVMMPPAPGGGGDPDDDRRQISSLRW
jgi:hypothetical protein